MIWLASFPRSGNTFFRNILYEVYGLESSAYHQETSHPVMNHYDRYPVVKTHLLPGQLTPSDKAIPAVYLIRDGRDALLSMAHQQKNLMGNRAGIRKTIKEGILASGNSYFGGWGENMRQWLLRADLVIRFEYLIEHPIEAVESLRAIMDLPSPQVQKLPGFEQLKFGNPKYGSSKRRQRGPSADNQFFRSGKTKGWTEAFDGALHDLFWKYHGPVMELAGYQKDGTPQNLKLELTQRQKEKLRTIELPKYNRPYTKVLRKLHHFVSPPPKRPIRHAADYIFVDLLSKAGVPAREVLGRIFGKNEIMEVQLYGKGAEHKGRLPDRVKVITGRFSLHDINCKFQSEKKPKVIIWLCHPAEMIITEYHVLEREWARMLKEEEREINLRKRMQKNITEYGGDYDNRNRWQKFIDQTDLKQFDFIGTNDDFIKDARRLHAFLEKEGLVDGLHLQELLKYRGDYLNTAPEAIETLGNFNDKDAQAYRLAKTIK